MQGQRSKFLIAGEVGGEGVNRNMWMKFGRGHEWEFLVNFCKVRENAL